MTLIEGPIVLLTTGSRDSLTALPDVALFAAALGCPLTILHIIGDADRRASDQRIAAALAALPDDIAQPNVLTMLPTEVSAALDRIGHTTGGTLVLLARRSRSLSRLLVGNEYERLLRNGPLPLIALPVSARLGEVQRILFPADYAPRSLAAFDAAVRLCQLFQAELHVLHVYGDDRLLPNEVDRERRSAARNPRELLAIDQELMRGLVARAAAHNVRVCARTTEGRAHTKILEYTAANTINMIVMPSHGPRTVEDIMLGTTTVQVIQRAPVPVLAMRTKYAEHVP